MIYPIKKESLVQLLNIIEYVLQRTLNSYGTRSIKLTNDLYNGKRCATTYTI